MANKIWRMAGEHILWRFKPDQVPRQQAILHAHFKKMASNLMENFQKTRCVTDAATPA